MYYVGLLNDAVYYYDAGTVIYRTVFGLIQEFLIIIPCILLLSKIHRKTIIAIIAAVSFAVMTSFYISLHFASATIFGISIGQFPFSWDIHVDTTWISFSVMVASIWSLFRKDIGKKKERQQEQPL